MHEKIERRLGRLEFIAFVLQVLHAIEDLRHQRLVVRDVVFGRLREDRGLAGQLADEDAAFIADQGRIDVLVARRGLGDGVGVHATLVGEGT